MNHYQSIFFTSCQFHHSSLIIQKIVSTRKSSSTSHILTIIISHILTIYQTYINHISTIYQPYINHILTIIKPSFTTQWYPRNRPSIARWRLAAPSVAKRPPAPPSHPRGPSRWLRPGPQSPWPVAMGTSHGKAMDLWFFLKKGTKSIPFITFLSLGSIDDLICFDMFWYVLIMGFKKWFHNAYYRAVYLVVVLYGFVLV